MPQHEENLDICHFRGARVDLLVRREQDGVVPARALGDARRHDRRGRVATRVAGPRDARCSHRLQRARRRQRPARGSR